MCTDSAVRLLGSAVWLWARNLSVPQLPLLKTGDVNSVYVTVSWEHNHLSGSI
jgi:hypothetical protein